VCDGLSPSTRIHHQVGTKWFATMFPTGQPPYFFLGFVGFSVWFSRYGSLCMGYVPNTSRTPGYIFFGGFPPLLALSCVGNGICRTDLQLSHLSCSFPLPHSQHPPSPSYRPFLPLRCLKAYAVAPPVVFCQKRTLLDCVLRYSEAWPFRARLSSVPQPHQLRLDFHPANITVLSSFPPFDRVLSPSLGTGLFLKTPRESPSSLDRSLLSVDEASTACW